MRQDIKNYLGIALIILSAVFAYAAISYTMTYSNSVRLAGPSFSVSGEGTITVIPDIARFTFSVITEGGKNLANLQSENTGTANNVINFLKENGVSSEDIKTERYNVSPRYQYTNCFERADVCPPAEITGYTISQSVGVKVRDLDKAGDILAGVVGNGANSVSQLTFTIDDPAKVENKARAEAITQAKIKAKAIADASGFKLGRILSIDTNNFSPIPYYRTGGIDGFRVEATPLIEPGSEDVTVNITLIYEIK